MLTAGAVILDVYRRQRLRTVLATLGMVGHQTCEALVPVAFGLVIDRAVRTGDGGAMWLSSVGILLLFTALTFSVRRDDGIVMWLNNPALPTVVSADGTFNAPYSYAGLAPNATSTGTYLTYSVPASQLVAGTNILAVELHQTSITSSDLLLDCGLVATYAAPFVLAFDAAGGQPVLYWFDSAALLEESSDLHHWSPVPAGLSPFPFAFDVPARFFRLRK